MPRILTRLTPQIRNHTLKQKPLIHMRSNIQATQTMEVWESENFEGSKKKKMGSSCPPSDDLSVMVLASDLGIDARPFLSKQQDTEIEEQEQEQWHDCAQYLSPDEDFSDLDSLQFFCLQGSDKSGNRIFRLVGKYFPGNQTPSSSRVYIIIRLCFFF